MPTFAEAIAWARTSVLARNFFVQLVNFSSQIFIQFLFLFFITKTLGTAGYGVFASLTAITVLASIVNGFGGELLMLKRVSADHGALRESVGHALMSALVTTPFVAALVFAVTAALYSAHMALWAIALVVVADLVFTKLLQTANYAFLSLDKVAAQLFLSAGYAAVRVVAVTGALLTLEDVSLNDWAIWYFGATAAWGLFAIGLTIALLGAPILKLRVRDWGLGLQFMVDQSAQAGFKEMDKPAVVQAAGPALGGVYTLTFRLAEAATTPVRALLYAVATRFFRSAAAEGPEGGVGFGLRVVPVAVALSGVIGAGMIAVAGLTPLVFGEDFQGSVGALRVLAVYPLFIALTFIGADILRATDRQHIRVAIILSSALLTPIAVSYGASAHGLYGAVLARLALQALAAGVAWAFVIWGAGGKAALAESPRVA